MRPLWYGSCLFPRKLTKKLPRELSRAQKRSLEGTKKVPTKLPSKCPRKLPNMFWGNGFHVAPKIHIKYARPCHKTHDPGSSWEDPREIVQVRKMIQTVSSWIFKYLKNEGKRPIFDGDIKYRRSREGRRYMTEMVSGGIHANMMLYGGLSIV